MKSKFNYIKKIIKVLLWPILFIICHSAIQYIFVAIFNKKEKAMSSFSEFLNYMKTEEYKFKLDNYMNSKAIYIVLISALILIPIFYSVFKNYKKKNSYKLKNMVEPIIYGITISLIYNILFYNLNRVVYFTDKFNGSNIPIWIQIISAGIYGPIIEEIIFRGIVYNKLKEFNKPMKSIILTSVIFGIFHIKTFDIMGLLDVIYAFGVSFMFIYLYEKYKTLKAPIIMHSILNITIIVMLPLIKFNFAILNLLLLFISLIVLVIMKIKIIDKSYN